MARVERNKATLTKVAEAIGSTVGIIVAKADTAKNALTKEIKKHASSAPVKKARQKGRKAVARTRRSAKTTRGKASRKAA